MPQVEFRVSVYQLIYCMELCGECMLDLCIVVTLYTEY